LITLWLRVAVELVVKKLLMVAVDGTAVAAVLVVLELVLL
jgi:hypothetical protein